MWLFQNRTPRHSTNVRGLNAADDGKKPNIMADVFYNKFEDRRRSFRNDRCDYSKIGHPAIRPMSTG